MKTLRIVFLLAFLVLAGAWLSATESLVLENEQPVLNSKTVQADTVRMTWKGHSYRPSYFSFYGEKGATYKVDWGDGETDTYTGKGTDTVVDCRHSYNNDNTYTVRLYGVSK